MYYKGRIVDAVTKMLTGTAPKKPPSGNLALTPAEINDIANRVADWYIRAVDEFLRTHPGAKPKQGTRRRPYVAIVKSGRLDNEFNRPFCADWARSLLGSGSDFLDGSVQVGSSSVALNQIVKIEHLQWHSLTGYREHNYLLVRPFGYQVANPPATDNVITVLDPWISILPEVFTAPNHPYPASNIGIKK